MQKLPFDYINLINSNKKNKYHAQKTNIAGITFDSKKESERFFELQMLLKSGVITDLERQKRFQLIPKTKTERAVFYVADFVYKKDGKQICEDVKSSITKKNPAYIIKRKLFKFLYPEYVFLEN